MLRSSHVRVVSDLRNVGGKLLDKRIRLRILVSNRNKMMVKAILTLVWPLHPSFTKNPRMRVMEPMMGRCWQETVERLP